MGVEVFVIIKRAAVVVEPPVSSNRIFVVTHLLFVSLLVD
jgi:hypothetical protein